MKPVRERHPWISSPWITAARRNPLSRLDSFLKEQQWQIPFATAAVESGEVPRVPASAVLKDAGERVVFVQLGGEAFERRVVETGTETDGTVSLQSPATAAQISFQRISEPECSCRSLQTIERSRITK